MKAGLFGGEWDDISGAIDDHFNGLTGGAPDFPPSPGPDAPFGSGYSFDPNSPATPVGIGGPIVMNASSKFGAPQAGVRALEAMASSAGTPVQPMVFRPERDKEAGAVMPPVEILLADTGANTGSTDMTADGAGGTPAALPAAKAPAIDQGFLAGREGGQQPQAYLPGPLKQPAPPAGKDPGAGVGITVATGVDLGAHTAEICGAGVSARRVSPLWRPRWD